MSIYKQQQHLTPWIRWGAVVLVASLMIFGILAGTIWESNDDDQLISMLVSILGGLLGIIVAMLIRLDLKLNREFIEYRMFPLEWKKKTIKVSEIASIEVRKFKRFPGYGGFGKRRKPWKKEIAYLLSWKAGLFIRLKDGKLRVFSTENAIKLEQFIQKNYPELINQNSNEKV